MTKRLITLVAALAALALFVGACGDDDEGEGTAATQQSQPAEPAPPPEGNDVVALAQGERDLSTLVQAVTAAGLVETLKGDGPFTVFAPTNDAFRALGEEKVAELLEPANRDQLKEILTYHVVPGELTADRLKDGQKLKTVQGDTLTVRLGDGGAKVNDANVVKPDVTASNGVVHVIDGVLTPGG